MPSEKEIEKPADPKQEPKQQPPRDDAELSAFWKKLDSKESARK